MLRNCCPWKMNQKGIHDITKIKMHQWGKLFGIHRPTFSMSLHDNTSVVKSLVHLSHPIALFILWPPGRFSRASHIHKAACCSFSVSFMAGTLFSLSSLAFPALQQHQLYKISSCTRAVAQSPGAASDDLQLLSLLSNSCSFSLISPSIKHSGVLPGQLWAKLLSWEPHVLPFGGGGCLLRGFSFWAAFAWINSSEGFSWSFYVNTLQNMFCTVLSPAIKILESEFGCQFYWCRMGYSRIQLSLLEIYWLGSAESNKTVFLISKPSWQDSRRNIGSKHAIIRRFLPVLSLFFSDVLLNKFGYWRICLVGLSSGIKSGDQSLDYLF